MATPPPRKPTGGTAILLILVLLVVIAGLAVWGWSSAPPATPRPSATANPAILPPSGSPTQPQR